MINLTLSRTIEVKYFLSEDSLLNNLSLVYSMLKVAEGANIFVPRESQ